jgi:peptidoglycan/LPS O-acetylase OafA/YrhL
MSGNSHKLEGVEAARGVAALLVVLLHAGNMLARDGYLGQVPLGGFFGFGHAGVDFFFVLSGFIILFVHYDDIGKPNRLRRYAGRRATRIYPAYWVATLLWLALLLVSPTRDVREADPFVVLYSFLLVPQSGGPVLEVGWTLQHEVLFYLLFALLIINARAGAIAFAAWAIFIVGAAVFQPTGFPWAFLGSSFNTYFFVGMASAFFVRRVQVGCPLLLLGGGAALFLATGLSENAALFERAGLVAKAGFGAASFCMLLGLVALEQRGRLRMPRAMARLGAASYSLYLIHTIVILVLAKGLFVSGLGRALPSLAVFAGAVGTALIAALAFHRWVEAPLLSALRPARGARMDNAPGDASRMQLRPRG